MNILDQIANTMFEGLPLERWMEHSEGFKTKRRARAARALKVLGEYCENRNVSFVATAADIYQIIDEFADTELSDPREPDTAQRDTAADPAIQDGK